MSLSIPIRLRGHHLLCLLTYAGKGYSPAFVAGMDRIAARLTEGVELLLVDGPDDICAPLLADGCDPHCRAARVHARDRLALAATAARLGRELAPGTRLRLDAADVADLRAAFAAGTTRAACGGCEWDGLCTRIATAGFPGVKLHPAGG